MLALRPLAPSLSPSSLGRLIRQASSKSSNAYIARHKADPYVSARGAFRARSAFKLRELDDEQRLLKPSVHAIVDLGAAPGGWSQVLMQMKGAQKKVIVAVDRLPMEPIPGVHIVQGDFLEEITQARVRKILRDNNVRNGRADLVLSDMAGNVSGNVDKDQEAAVAIAKACYEFVRVALRPGHFFKTTGAWRPGGNLVMKHFTYPELDDFKREYLDRIFETTAIVKPDASRNESAEAFWVCKGFKGDVLTPRIAAPEPEQRFVEDDEDADLPMRK